MLVKVESKESDIRERLKKVLSDDVALNTRVIKAEMDEFCPQKARSSTDQPS